MNGQSLVTVYILTYNFEKYLERSIRSVLRQAFKDWELIIINDGSTDGTDRIISKYENNPKVTIVRQKNKGLTTSSNIALRLSRGKYIMRLDGDDYLDENALLVMVSYMEENPDVGLVYPDYYLIDEHGEILSLERRKKLGSEAKLLDLPAHGACTIFRKNLLLEHGGYNEEVSCQDCYDIWIKFIHHHKVSNINLPLFFYRQHGHNITRDKKKILDARRLILNRQAEIKRNIQKNKNIKRIAIIPIRAHTDFEYRLALRKIHGKAVIDYTIDEALEAKCFDKVIVCSEDDAILEHVKAHYPQVATVRRPLKLSYRNVLLEKTINFVFKALYLNRRVYQEIMILYIESILKRKEHILKAIDTLRVFDTDSVVSLVETNNMYYMHGKHGMERIGNTESFRLERKNIYEGNGAMLLIKTKNLKGKTLEGQRRGHIIMLREESVRIMTPLDHEIAEMLLEKRKKENAGKI